MDILPRNYSLTFEPDLEKFTFKGKETIAFELKKETKRIVLDAVDLNIVDCQLLIAGKDIVSSYKIDNKEEKLLIYLSQELRSGEYKLFIEFIGILNDKLAGFYRSKYVVDGKEKYLATTQFEAADARRAFPCIDHPSYKATFEVSFVIDKHLTAVSNTLLIDDYNATNSTKAVKYGLWQVGKKGKKMVIFERTPLMSTYLLYLGVGEFEFLEDKFGDVLLRVITTPGKKQYGKFALECAKKSLEYFEEYFVYPYPLKKLDLIAVPEFATGAMENWGAITFRENALLFYPDKSSRSTMQRIAEIVAHEIAHQWFGNLVTLRWWDDLWLNESLATYMANKVIAHYLPEWDIWSQYVTDTVFEGMGLDSLKSSHPIKVTVKNTSELDELFDEIAYEKGGSILRMLDLYLGKKVFRKGLRKYIKKYKYKNAEAKDLWNSLEKQTDKPILNMMQRYISQVGFPEVKIELKNGNIRLEQTRFLFTDDEFGTKKLWSIPYHLDHDRGQDGMYLLETRIKELRKTDEINFLNLNINYSGFFISNYSEELLGKLGKNIDSLNDQDKLGIVHDLFALILARKKDLTMLFRYIEKFFTDERSSIVLHYVISKLTGIYLLLQDETSKELAKKFSRKALEIVEYEPKKNETILDTYLRVAALSSLTLFDDRVVSRFVNKQFIGYLENKNSLHPDLRAVVYSSALWFDEGNYEVLKKEYEDSQVQEEKAKLLSALGLSKNKSQIKATLRYLLTAKVSFAFLPYVVSTTARNPYGKKTVLDWLMANWIELVKRSGGMANMLLRRILQAVISQDGIGREKEVESFLKKNKVIGLERTIKQVLEELRIYSKFVNRYKK